MIGEIQSIPYIHVMRYMGNKKKLLPYILEKVHRMAEPGKYIVDLMAGTHSLGYALKSDFRIAANDVQRYTLPIGEALLSEKPIAVKPEEIRDDLEEAYQEHQQKPVFRFLQDNYGDTYFSPRQCAQLDGIRFAIEQLPVEKKKAFYLTALMKTACIAQSTPGHFAQYMPKNHRRILPLRKIDIWECFVENAINMKVRKGKPGRIVKTKTWRQLLLDKDIRRIASEVGLVYIDPPYSQEQYSRFYHLLETLVLYDSPTIAHKAKYRDDRFKSDFCYKGRVEGEFSDMLQQVGEAFGCPILLSYGSKGLLKKERLLQVCRNHFRDVELLEIDYAHSTLGKGLVSDNKEYLVSMSGGTPPHVRKGQSTILPLQGGIRGVKKRLKGS